MRNYEGENRQDTSFNFPVRVGINRIQYSMGNSEGLSLVFFDTPHGYGRARAVDFLLTDADKKSAPEEVRYLFEKIGLTDSDDIGSRVDMYNNGDFYWTVRPTEVTKDKVGIKLLGSYSPILLQRPQIIYYENGRVKQGSIEELSESVSPHIKGTLDLYTNNYVQAQAEHLYHPMMVELFHSGLCWMTEAIERRRTQRI